MKLTLWSESLKILKHYNNITHKGSNHENEEIISTDCTNLNLLSIYGLRKNAC